MGIDDLGITIVMLKAKTFSFFESWAVSVMYVTLVPWRRERRRHVGGPTNWDIA